MKAGKPDLRVVGDTIVAESFGEMAGPTFLD